MNGEKKNITVVHVKRYMSMIKTVEIIKVMKGLVRDKYISALLIAGERWQVASHCVRSGHS